MAICPYCESEVSDTALKCKHCGEYVTEVEVQTVDDAGQVSSMHYSLPANQVQEPPAGFMPPPGYPPQYPQPVRIVPTKSKLVAGLLALFLGGLGIHHFYLGKIGLGVVYLLLCWTYIPSIIAFIEAIVYFCTSDETWNARYG